MALLSTNMTMYAQNIYKKKTYSCQNIDHNIPFNMFIQLKQGRH